MSGGPGGYAGTGSPPRERGIPGGRPPGASTGTRQRGGGIGRAAVLIGAITMLARVIGFGRQVVFAHTVQASCLGTAYTTANMVPNIIYDIVMGGALTAVVVPVLAGPALSGSADRGQVRQISGALLTWTVLLLVPVSAVVALAARPLVSLLLGATPGCPRPDMVAVATRMLVVFAPQILLYGLAVVLYGILQAHRRFAAPALAPVLSSLVVIEERYFWFGAIGNGYQDMLRPVPAAAWIVLAAGTTAGVAALVATPLIPAARLHLTLRPTLRFPAGVGARVRSLATAGIATLIAQDASVAVVIVLANSPRRQRHAGAVQLRLGRLLRALRRAGRADRDQRVPRAVRAFGQLRRDQRHLYPRGDGGVLAGDGRDRPARACRWHGYSSPTPARPPTPGSWP